MYGDFIEKMVAKAGLKLIYVHHESGECETVLFPISGGRSVFVAPVDKFGLPAESLFDFLFERLFPSDGGDGNA